jgi:hypothetical protein
MIKVLLLTSLYFFTASVYMPSFVFSSDNSEPKQSNSASAKEVYELSEKCAKFAAQEFKRIYGQEAEVRVDYTNHYNIKLNKCFVLITDLVPKNNISTKYLMDINEHRQTAGFTSRSSGDKIRIWECEVSGTNCHSESEWDALVKPYMEE